MHWGIYVKTEILYSLDIEYEGRGHKETTPNVQVSITKGRLSQWMEYRAWKGVRVQRPLGEHLGETSSGKTKWSTLREDPRCWPSTSTLCLNGHVLWSKGFVVRCYKRDCSWLFQMITSAAWGSWGFGCSPPAHHCNTTLIINVTTKRAQKFL